MKKTILIAAAALSGVLALAGCGTTAESDDMAASAQPATKAGFEKAMADAEAARKAAAAVDGEWRDTGKIMKMAQEKAAEGNYEAAIELARTAEFQGKKGMEQAMEQKGAGNPSYLTN
ncbi:MAG: hypothetical protein PVG98_11790 [Chromatiales bacterium]|jgi:hypothetical protein